MWQPWASLLRPRSLSLGLRKQRPLCFINATLFRSSSDSADNLTPNDHLAALLDRYQRKRISDRVSKKATPSERLTRLLRSMPKEEPHLMPLREHRVAKRKRLHEEKRASDQITFHVVGNGLNDGQSRALFLSTDYDRYMFNCAEGTQRLLSMQTANKAVAQLTNVFLTSRTWRNLGGLPGTCLSSRKAGAPDIKVHGPDGVMSLFNMTKNFMQLQDYNVVGYNQSQSGVFRDCNLTAEAVPLAYDASLPPVLPEVLKYGDWDPNQFDDRDKKNIPTGLEAPSSSKAKDEDWQTVPVDMTVVAYVLTVLSKPGKLDVKKCMELGVPPGPLLGELKAGRDVILDDGSTVKSAQVTGKRLPNAKFLVIECPSEHYFTSLKSTAALNDSLAQDVSCIFHFTPDAVMATEEYQGWMSQFSSDKTRHVVLNEKNGGLGNQKAIHYTKQLQSIAPKVFDLTHMTQENKDPSDADSKHSGNIIYAPNGLQIHPRAVEEDGIVSMAGVNTMEKIDLELKEEASTIEGWNEELEAAHEKMVLDETKPAYPRVTFLGTGSSEPSQYRNVTGILIETKPNSFMILDCGEGTLNQLETLFGRDRSREILLNLKAIYVSHLHADHHLGLISLLQARNKIVRQTGNDGHDKKHLIYVIAPGRISHFLGLYHRKFESVLTDAYQVKNEHLLLLRPNSNLVEHNGKFKVQPMNPDMRKAVLEHCSLTQLATCRAHHCPASFCVSLTTDENFKIVYTGDTRPTSSLVEMGLMDKQPDLLIHEATMEHLLLDDARHKRHSTFTEAVESGEAMQAAFTILTHFSQRYTKMPLLDEFRERKKVAVAFDNMTVSPQMFGFLRHMYPCLLKVFHETYGLMEDRSNNFKIKLKYGKTPLPDLHLEETKDLEEEGAEAKRAKIKK